MRRRQRGRATLFDEVCERLPLFDGLSEEAVERLAAGGMGRGLLTAALRARLRRSGFADMGMLALATPADLTAVRKIGPVRISAIRAHVLDELTRFFPDARAAHGEEATARRRTDRLGAIPAERLLLDAVTIERLDCAGNTCADLALRRRADCVSAPGILAVDLDMVVAVLARLLLPDRSRARPVVATREDDAEQEARARRERAETLREQDREWEAAAPAKHARPAARSRVKP